MVMVVSLVGTTMTVVQGSIVLHEGIARR